SDLRSGISNWLLGWTGSFGPLDQAHILQPTYPPRTRRVANVAFAATPHKSPRCMSRTPSSESRHVWRMNQEPQECSQLSVIGMFEQRLGLLLRNIYSRGAHATP